MRIRDGKKSYYGFIVKNKGRKIKIIQTEGFIVLCVKKFKVMPNKRIKETVFIYSQVALAN